MNLVPNNPIIREWLFIVTKYVTYGLLCLNGYLFYVDELAASEVTFARSLTFSEVIEVYSASIDSAFWIMLVVLLELETYVIDDRILKRPAVKWTMIGLRTLCYLFIVYALYGYIVKMEFQSDMIPFLAANTCDVVSQNFSILIAVENYVPLTAENCQTLTGTDLYQLNGYNIIAPLDVLVYARNVSWIDVINASSWLAVVLVLEVDVWYQLQDRFTGRIVKLSTAIKIVLYTALFGCAVAWGYTGVLLDFADSALWLFAFFFIELNLVQWQRDTANEAKENTSRSTSRQQ